MQSCFVDAYPLSGDGVLILQSCNSQGQSRYIKFFTKKIDDLHGGDIPFFKVDEKCISLSA
jgi:hypothetical protein